MPSNDKTMTTDDLNRELGKGEAPKADAPESLALAPYVAAQTVAINNRNQVMYLVEGESVDLTEGEAQVLISLGYITAPEIPPEGRKGKRAEIDTPEKHLGKREER